jgi:hypothetical protein
MGGVDVGALRRLRGGGRLVDRAGGSGARQGERVPTGTMEYLKNAVTKPDVRPRNAVRWAGPERFVPLRYACAGVFRETAQSLRHGRRASPTGVTGHSADAFYVAPVHHSVCHDVSVTAGSGDGGDRGRGRDRRGGCASFFKRADGPGSFGLRDTTARRPRRTASPTGTPRCDCR